MAGNRAGRYIACDCHAHLVSKAGPVKRHLIHRDVVHWQATQYCVHYRRWFICDNERNIALLVSDLRLCVLNAAPFESRWWRFTANHGTGFTDEMRMIIAFDISPSPSGEALSLNWRDISSMAGKELMRLLPPFGWVLFLHVVNFRGEASKPGCF